MSQVQLAVRHFIPQRIRSHGSLKAKVQKTFDEMKSKAEEEASRQRSGLIDCVVEFVIYIQV